MREYVSASWSVVVGGAFVHLVLAWLHRSSSRCIICGIDPDGHPEELGSPISSVI